MAVSMMIDDKNAHKHCAIGAFLTCNLVCWGCKHRYAIQICCSRKNSL